MKKSIFIAIFLVLLALPIAIAHEEKADPGITPDSFLWGIDKAFDNINLLLTSNPSKRARKGLAIARERLEEVRAMAEKNEIEAAEDAKEEQLKALSKTKEAISAIKERDSTAQVEEEVEIEKELDEHENEVSELSDSLKIKMEVKGNLNEHDKAVLNFILSSLENKTGEVKVEIQSKRDRTKIEIRQKTGKSEKEVDEQINDIEERKGLTGIKKERAAEEIEEATDDLEGLEEELEEHKAEGHVANDTPIKTLINNAWIRLANAKEAMAKNHFGEAFGQANAAQQLIGNAERILEKTVEKFEDEEEHGMDEKEIKVEIEGNEAKVKIEIGDARFKFTLDTEDKGEIISEIAEKTGLSADEVAKLAEFESHSEAKGKTESEEEHSRGKEHKSESKSNNDHMPEEEH